MSRFTLIFSFLALCFAGCGDKSQTDKDEDERAKIREQKRLDAIVQYRRLAKQFPENENAEAAMARARALEAQAKP